MMDGYGYMSSGDWFGMAVLLMLWTLVVIVTTVWVAGARGTAEPRRVRGDHDADRG
jgi:hypothetical protein